MARGRPASGPNLVENLENSEPAKERLKIVLQTITGELSVPEACSRLQVGEARFHELRAESLAAAAQALEPKPAGRPPAPQPSEQQKRIAALEEQILELKIDLRAAQLREQIALVMPEVLENSKDRRRRLDAMQDAWDQAQVQKKTPAPSAPSLGASAPTPDGSSQSGKSST